MARPRRLALTTALAVVGAGTLATGLAVVGTGTLATSAIAASGAIPNASANFNFAKHDNPADPTFNQLLGINKANTIAGYFGSGLTGHPNKGYTLTKNGAGTYSSENYPGSVQTQVTGLNNTGVTVGFYSSAMGLNGPDFGFYAQGGTFHTADFPTSNPASPAIDQLLGVNDAGLAVGFYNTSDNNSHGYTYNINTHAFGTISVPGATSVTATGINDNGDIVGFATKSGNVVGFFKTSASSTVTLQVPGATATQAFGVNDGDVVVGTYTVGPNTYGFVWAPEFGFQTVNDPQGVGSTTINGINDHGHIVGFYTDASGNTDGFVGTPKAG
jgi:hypothetical protein